MSGLEFAARLTEALAWPVVGLIVALVLRQPITLMLGRRPPARFKAGPFEVEWDRMLAETESEVGVIASMTSDEQSISEGVRHELAEEAKVVPAVAVLEAHARVERELRELLGDLESPLPPRLGAVALARLAHRQGKISYATVRAVEGISVLRNLAAHGSAREITPEQANEYLDLVDAVLFALGSTIPFGIDLGTTNSCISYVDPLSGRPVVVPSAVGEDTTPSVVYFEARGKVLVGAAAKNSAVLAPHLTAQLVKRQMGRRDVVAEYHGQKYPPETISALILRELARTTQQDSQLVVRDVVIAVPAYFGVAERDATRKAGEIAGLTVLDLIEEPVAAALHYQSLHTGLAIRHLLVCDLGGGTFDTTVIRIDGDDIHVVCTDGDPRLGGADWDERIRDYLVSGFTAQHPWLDPTADEFIQSLTETAEQLKEDLSRTESRRTDLRFAGAVARLELTRGTLEELTTDLLDRVVEITERTIGVARRKGVLSFDDVVLVGGMTRMPAVGKRLAERLGLKPRLHEPDLAVAKGAALFARILQARRTSPEY